ncbi:helix-turn-helix domain-containing protein [Streptomyces sp. URMC 127]|uniref:helix-turn-helix domain-containing protein n=1 Tax=Streptomyces sp. URMC 127 TaxID=3423402 RepID=UPI003F195993
MELDRLVMLAKAPETVDPIEGLRAAHDVRREMERLEAVLVRRARTQGRTWAEIAEVLGISKQAVHKKYGGRGIFRSQA